MCLQFFEVIHWGCIVIVSNLGVSNFRTAYDLAVPFVTQVCYLQVFHKDVTPASGNTNVVAPRVTYLPPGI